MEYRSPGEILVGQSAGKMLVYPEDKTEFTAAASKVLPQVVGAAKAWWVSKKPVAYSNSEHLENPTINCCGEEEKELARAVAVWVKMGG